MSRDRGANPPLFGLNIDPTAADVQRNMQLVDIADGAGLDLIGVQDHPYISRFLDTWTLLSAIGAQTRRVRLLPNVVSLPLRPPAMLAKAAASLDVISGGRVELGLGAGAMWDGIVAYGGERREPRVAVDALEEAMQILRLLWQPSSEPVSFDGAHYQVHNASPGPRPAHDIGIWLGASRPRMLRLTGRIADGWSVSISYFPPESIPPMQTQIDGAAERAGRSPSQVRRLYNLFGFITSPGGPEPRRQRPHNVVGSAADWVNQLERFVAELGMDAFIFWPIADDPVDQARRFVEEVVPIARERLGLGAARPAEQ
jgi:alkanesulfonate monooxygenase SsuD/methylene tetrahydromethanopterin reductase-like flavin-dependent oxidoreductase (luciferase family)